MAERCVFNKEPGAKMCAVCLQILETKPDFFGDGEPCMAKYAQGPDRPDRVVKRSDDD